MKKIKFVMPVYRRGVPEYRIGDETELTADTQCFVRRGVAEVMEADTGARGPVVTDKPSAKKNR